MPFVESPLPETLPLVGFSDAETASFQRDGYVIARGLANAETVDTMRRATLDGLARGVGPVEFEADVAYPGAPVSRETTGGDTVRRLKQAIGRDPVFAAWVSSPELVTRLRQILGGDVVMPLAHHNCIMTKQPRFSSDTGWHQDIRYWRFSRPELVSVWLALGDETPENGCLRLIPGTHHGETDRAAFDEAQFLRPDLDDGASMISRQIHAELKPGDVLFFHCRTFHAASRNHTDETKYSAVFTFRPADNLPVAGTRSAMEPELLLPRVSGD